MNDRIQEPTSSSSDAIVLGVCLHSERPETGSGYSYVADSEPTHAVVLGVQIRRVPSKSGVFQTNLVPVAKTATRRATQLGIPAPSDTRK